MNKAISLNNKVTVLNDEIFMYLMIRNVSENQFRHLNFQGNLENALKMVFKKLTFEELVPYKNILSDLISKHQYGQLSYLETIVKSLQLDDDDEDEDSREITMTFQTNNVPNYTSTFLEPQNKTKFFIFQILHHANSLAKIFLLSFGHDYFFNSVDLSFDSIFVEEK